MTNNLDSKQDNEIAMAEAQLAMAEQSQSDQVVLASAMEKLAGLLKERRPDRLLESVNLEAKARVVRVKAMSFSVSALPVVEQLVDAKDLGQLGNYKLLSIMGKGSYGVVYRAEHASSGQPFAIKLFSKETLSDQTALKRFEQEAKILSNISHPNIVSVYEVGFFEQAPYMVMEFIPGMSLEHLISEKRSLSTSQAVAISREICRALSAAHEHDIVHRDVKPSNIVLDEKHTVKVVDFGIARNDGNSSGSSTGLNTQTGAVLGTAEYMSPEQCLGHRVDARSDIYSLGCVMFEMFTGKQAFAASNPVESIVKHVSGNHAYINHVFEKAHLPSNLRSIMLKAMQKDPDKRYQSVGELDNDLSAFQLGTNPRYAVRGLTSTQLWIIIVLMAGCVLFPAIIARRSSTLNSDEGTKSQIVQSPDSLSVPMSQPVPYEQPVRTAPPRYPEQEAIPRSDFQVFDRHSGKIILNAHSSPDLGTAINDAIRRHVSFRDADLQGVDLSGVHFLGGDFQNALFHSAKLSQTLFMQSNLNGADLSDANLNQAELNGSACRNTIFSEAEMTQTDMRHTDCTGANFEGARLIQTRFDSACLIGASFKGCHPSLVTIKGADLSDAVIPGIVLKGDLMSVESGKPESNGAESPKAAGSPEPGSSGSELSKPDPFKSDFFKLESPKTGPAQEGKK